MPNVYLPGFLGCKEDFSSFPDTALDIPEAHSFDSSVDSLAKHINKCTLIGYSMGGRIALHFAKKYPEKIERLVLISAHLGLKDPTERKKRLIEDLKWVKILEEKPLEEFLQKWYDQPLFKPLKENREAFEEMLKRRRNQNKLLLISHLTHLSLGNQEPFWNVLDSFTFPVLFIAGEKDEKYKTLYESIPSGPKRKTLFLPCGHVPHFECPNLLREYL